MGEVGPPEDLATAVALIGQLEAALDSRTIIARATGLLAARYRLSTDDSWRLLRHLSMLSNQKLTRVAQVVVSLHDRVDLSPDERVVAVAMAVVLDDARERTAPSRSSSRAQGAWELEEALWRVTTPDDVADFYAHTPSDEAVIIVAGRRLRPSELMTHVSGHAPPWSRFTMAERKTVTATDETVVLTYRLEARAPARPDGYGAYVTSVYNWTPAGWALVLRQHTPDPEVDAGAWLPESLASASSVDAQR